MSAVARLLLSRGVTVSGSDAADGPVLEALRQAGATVHVGHDPAHLGSADTVVVSSAIREDNPELAAARAAGLLVLHRAQALAALTAGRRGVAVAGANGKTTTTAMLTVALAAAGADPSFACGGEIPQLGTNAAVGDGPAFVVEADESDGTFVVYRPEIGVVTTVQPDHLDFYGTAEAVTDAYREFAATIADGGLLVASADDPGARSLAEQERARGRRVVTFGRAEDADLVVVSTAEEGLATRTVLRDRGVPRTLDLAVPGDHNVANACAAHLVAVEGLGLDPEAVLAGLAGFTGVRRRFEVRGEVDGVTVVDDYAHNPAKVAAVVAAAAGVVRRAGTGRVLVVFQPHLYSRTRDFAEAFARALAPADLVLVLDVFGAREDPVPGVGPDLVATPLAGLAGERTVVSGPSREDAVDRLVAAAGPGDLVLTVGAGDVTRLGPPILEGLRARTGATP
ncbi:UDP-N-acetylmuramate--L-alanine ligase [Phycicoccus sp. BSK3Z-2]|uniref:UDP-N-acetylmuramate--L-alanine ligase n=2 Tax=Phycicoccus avicenniae TaxID=2828860 RepID=A0A941D967_9MICO|nr:UDP-N-acetylmuramate--L-alanine ligase [Phycicoccus avicenniae]